MHRAAGFTLIELILVLVIAAGVMTIAIRFTGSGVSNTELKGAARSLAAGLRVARSEAITQREERALTLDLERREFRLSGDGRSRKMNDRIELKLFTAEQEVVDEKTGSIRFYGDGSSTGGRVTVAYGERKYEVDVDWLTGNVRILDEAPK